MITNGNAKKMYFRWVSGSRRVALKLPDMLTYLTENGKPIIRACANCKNFKKLKHDDKTGYCALMPMTFAYTLEQTVFAYVKLYYLCDNHVFTNETELEATCQKISMEDAVHLRKQAEGL